MAKRPRRPVAIQLSNKDLGISVEISGPPSSLPTLEAAAVQALGWLRGLAADPNLTNGGSHG